MHLINHNLLQEQADLFLFHFFTTEPSFTTYQRFLQIIFLAYKWEQSTVTKLLLISLSITFIFYCYVTIRQCINFTVDWQRDKPVEKLVKFIENWTNNHRHFCRRRKALSPYWLQVTDKLVNYFNNILR